MRTMFALVLSVTFSLGNAEAVQTCPPGNQRVAPDNRYTDHGNGTVTDNSTALMWKQCSEGQSGAGCSGTATSMNWSVALTAAADTSFAGFNDWRLPNITELKSLIETACFNPAVNEIRFPNTTLFYYWTSSSCTFDASLAWPVNLQNGLIDNYNNKSSNLGVRLVRGG